MQSDCLPAIRIFSVILCLASSGIRAETPSTEKSEVPAKKGEGGEKPVPPAVTDAAKAKAPKPQGAVSFHTVKAGAFVVRAKVSGTVESLRETPIEMDLKRWSDMTVVRVVAHGTPVKAGDVLIELDTRELKKKIADLNRELPTQELDLAAAELELDKAEKATPLSLEQSLRQKMQAEQDLAHFEDEARPMQERGAREDVKEVAEAVAYEQEELNQLRKMYEKDNLTEETEEIILRRAEHSVARYQWMLEQTQARTERTLNTLLPREHENLKRNLEMLQIQWRAGEKATRDGLEKLRLSTAAKRLEMEEVRKTLAEHEEDLAKMRVTAPHDGIVYYGMSQRAKWTTASIVDRKLIPGGKLMMREIVMTVVDPAKVRVRLSLTEEQLKDLAEGQRGVCQAKWKPDFKFAATLDSILYVPFSDKTFDGILSLKAPKDAPALLPGMSADAELVVYEKPDALLVPKAAVAKEGERDLVTLKDGKKVPVKTGRSEGDRIEILDGLEAGAVLRLPEAKPEAAKAPETKTAPAKP